jgi:hypothetical protein
MKQWWLVYVRWDSGHRETIRCIDPDKLANAERLWVLACLPSPKVSTRPGK